MTSPPLPRTEFNGAIASADVLRVPALLNYGHFTTMQVHQGCVRGLDLHMDRLAQGTQELFGHPLDLEQTRTWMRQIVGDDERALSLRVTIFSRAFDRERPLEAAAPDVLITTSAARTRSAAPLRVGSVRYQRELAHLKHVGTFGLFHHKRLAQARGFDDALFVDPSGAISEGSVWNIGFLDDAGVVWSDAPALPGISMQLLQRGLRESGFATRTQRVELGRIAHFRSAFFTNSSCAVMPIACIDDVAFDVDARGFAALETCYMTNPPQPL
jgi:branched-subunit amino acid aminotransferase/4-amino-4-deoxychorismate lyase